MHRELERIRRGVVAAACTLLVAGLAQASPTFYTTEAAFFTNLTGPSHTLDFEGLPVSTLLPSGSVVGGIAFTYTIPGFTMQIRDDFGTTSGTHYLGVNSIDGTFLSGDAFTMTFVSPVTALGLYVIGAPGANVAGDFELTALGSGSVFNSSTPDISLTDGDAYFLGIIDPAGFTSADMNGTTTNCDPATGCQYVWNVDDITTAGLASVPEPSSLFLLGSGLAGLTGVARRRRGKEFRTRREGGKPDRAR